MNYEVLKNREAAEGDFIGNFRTTYNTIVSSLGKPVNDGWLDFMIWKVEFENGLIAQIYSFKEETNKDNMIYDWKVSGNRPEAYKQLECIVSKVLYIG